MEENTGHLKYVTKNSNPEHHKKPQKNPQTKQPAKHSLQGGLIRNRDPFSTGLLPWLILLLQVTVAHQIMKRAGKPKLRHTCRLCFQWQKILLCICSQSLPLLQQVQALQRIPLKYRLLMQPTPPQLLRFTT